VKDRLLLAAALIIAAAPHGYAASPAPKDFLTDAIQGDASEIKLGQLAQQNGGSAEVRDFGKTLVADHQKAAGEVKDTAKQLGVTVNEQPTAEAQSEHDKLTKLKGAAFDKEFVHYMVSDHQKDIADFKAEADAKAGPASSLAEKQLPVLQKHLQMARSLENQQAEAP
jgi:putative membrane protein